MRRIEKCSFSQNGLQISECWVTGHDEHGEKSSAICSFATLSCGRTYGENAYLCWQGEFNGSISVGSVEAWATPGRWYVGKADWWWSWGDDSTLPLESWWKPLSDFLVIEASLRLTSLEAGGTVASWLVSSCRVSILRRKSSFTFG